MFAKKIGELGGPRNGRHIRIGIGQDPLCGCVVVLYSGGILTQDDHVARVVRQLLWREEIVNQGRAEATQPETRLGWVIAGAAFVEGEAFPFILRLLPRLICESYHAIVGVFITCIMV